MYLILLYYTLFHDSYKFPFAGLSEITEEDKNSLIWIFKNCFIRFTHIEMKWAVFELLMGCTCTQSLGYSSENIGNADWSSYYTYFSLFDIANFITIAFYIMHLSMSSSAIDIYFIRFSMYLNLRQYFKIILVMIKW